MKERLVVGLVKLFSGAVVLCLLVTFERENLLLTLPPSSFSKSAFKMNNFIKNQQNNFDLGLEVLLLKEDDFIVAYCPSLNLSSFGSDIQEAKKAFHEALQLFMDDIIERGTLEKALLDLGWTLRKQPTAEFKPPSSYKLQTHQSLQQKFRETISVPV